MSSTDNKEERLSVEDFVPAVIGLDLSGTMRDIEKRLMPSTKHHEEIRAAHNGAGFTAFDIERSILRAWKKLDYGKKDKYGLWWYEHILMFMKLLMPKTVITPSFVDLAKATQIAIAEGKELLNQIGAKSSGKTAWSTRIALTLLAIDPDYTRVYCAAPFKMVADLTIWSELKTCFTEIENRYKGVFPDMKETPSAKLLQLTVGSAKAGRVDLIGLDNVGKLQGTKSRDPRRGFMILLADEIALFPTHDFLQVLDNITSNSNLIVFDGCNFKTILGMDGILCDPVKCDYGDLNIERDQIWNSAYNSLTIRLDGHLCPNVLEKRDIYPFLLSEKKRENMEIQHTDQGPKYLEQIRSFPHMSAEDEFLISMDRLRSGGCFDDFFSKQSENWTRVAFLDPGWGGDPCKIGVFEFGEASLQTHEGGMVSTTIFKPLVALETIRVRSGLKADIEFLNKLTAVSNGPVMLKEGREVTMDLQIAVASAEFLIRHKVNRTHFGFDSSLRGSIVQELSTVMGPEINVYDLGNYASDMVASADGTTGKDRYRNLRSECYFNLQLLVASGQLRGANMIMPALLQACRHRVIKAGMKDAVEPKHEYKKVNMGKSPDDSDVLVGAISLARKKGFPMSFDRSAKSVSLATSFQFDNIRPRPRIARLSR